MTTIDLLPPDPLKLTDLTDCGGCAAKLGADLLADALSGLGAEAAGDVDSALIAGLTPPDDAAAYRVSDDLAIIGTLDFFPPLVDDPRTFGEIAATNALSDVFAMGGRVLFALSIAAFPEELPRDVLAAIFEGASAKVREAGGTLAGGHTIRDAEPKYGLAVVGAAHPDRLLRKGGARPGDVLILTKRLGTGILVSGSRQGRTAEADLAAAIEGMRTLNRAASEVLVEHRVAAATDVTGFGLLGHGLEMARASGTRYVFDADALPALDGALVTRRGRRRDGRCRAQPTLCPAGADGRRWGGRGPRHPRPRSTDQRRLARGGRPRVDRCGAPRPRPARRAKLAYRSRRGRRARRPPGLARGIMEVIPGIRRLGTNDKVGVYLIEDAGAITVVDAGMPGYFGDLQAELAEMGRTIADIRAVLLTHAHTDHIGFAERIRREHAVPIQIHEADAALAQGKVKQKNEGGGPVRLIPMLSFIGFAIRKGLIRIERIKEVSTFGDGATLDVPGAPRVIHLPGHTAGSAALHLPDRDAILVGDAFVTLNVMSGSTGPQLFPNFNADNAQAVESLGRLDAIEARFVLPGHGEPWSGGMTEALRLVRASKA